MQQQQPPQHGLSPRAPSPQDLGGGPAFSPMQGIGIGASSSSSSQAAAAAAASAHAAAQMAYEDAWKASHPDFRTPFASVEDAITRLLPYHVFADYEEDNTDGGTEEISKDEIWDKGVERTVSEQIEEFHKQVRNFNDTVVKHTEERLMLERALLQDEHRATERLRAALVVQHEQQQRRQQKEDAERARLALAQAQAQVASAWPLVQPTASAWQQALAAVAAARGEGGAPGQVEAGAAQGTAMHPQLDPATAGAWLMMHQQHQQQQQQQLQLQQQEQLQHQQQQQVQQQLGVGAWPTYAAPHGAANSMGQAGPSAVWQEQAGEPTMGGTAAGGMAQPWWLSGAPRREQ